MKTTPQGLKLVDEIVTALEKFIAANPRATGYKIFVPQTRAHELHQLGEEHLDAASNEAIQKGNYSSATFQAQIPFQTFTVSPVPHRTPPIEVR